MDPYEYLLNKLDVKIINNIDRKYNMESYCEIQFKKDCVGVCGSNITAKNIFQYVNCNGLTVGVLNSELIRIIKLLRQFPNDLESTEQVDLLLAVNGLQTSDEKSS